MIVKEFFASDKIEDFDFADDIIKHSNIKDKELKEEYLNETDVFKKYLIYKTKFRNADPDGKGGLLKAIYKELWDEDYLELCKCYSKSYNCIYYSDTLTSTQGLIRDFYVQVYNDEKEKGQKELKSKDCPIDKMVEMYNNPCDYPIFEKYFIKDNPESKIIKDFIEYYHTLGNYIPVPEGFNSARSGNFASHDMWDITLMKIKEYYDSDSKSIQFDEIESTLLELLHYKGALITTQKWLDQFKSWQGFVDKNYLKKDGKWDNYVDEDYNIDSFFGEKHDFNNPKLKNKNDYLEYFAKITSVIKGRTNIIKNAYNQKIKES